MSKLSFTIQRKFLFGSVDRVEENRKFIKMQIGALGLVGLSALVALFVEFVSPDTFNFTEYWLRTDEGIVSSVQRFWPLLVYAGIMATISTTKIVQWVRAEEILKTGLVVSVLAGIWEELGYRCFFILTSIIGIWFFNIAFAWVVPIFLLIFFVASKGSVFWRVFFLTLFVMSLVWVLQSNLGDPIYWFYENIVFPVLNFVSFGLLKPILWHPEFSALFIMGAVSANSKFRDGHKYQGSFGMLNSWIIGFILLYSMMFYGLVVAIIIHILYDIEFNIVRYIARKIH